MNYNTVEAYLDKTKIIFEDDYLPPRKKTKVLITFIEPEDEKFDLVELDEDKVPAEFIKLKQQVLKKDKSLFTNI